ncbi:hypothetical protein PVNG_02377 [Plasmodium vivax North Korean]|uniref:J domain-containing protein n=1 Tax=Plasmodium vivax North Korean TaxID=1035514 RepID=A0A0J9TLP5_PLAVI|nr:hypothetical protein PVNG_02377 [Plasmodium vivax North Korean]
MIEFYKELGLSETATQEEIDKAYEVLKKKYSKTPNKPSAKMIRIERSYQALCSMNEELEFTKNKKYIEGFEPLIRESEEPFQ